jgi:hypothetical protein
MKLASLMVFGAGVVIISVNSNSHWTLLGILLMVAGLVFGEVLK